MLTNVLHWVWKQEVERSENWRHADFYARNKTSATFAEKNVYLIFLCAVIYFFTTWENVTTCAFPKSAKLTWLTVDALDCISSITFIKKTPFLRFVIDSPLNRRQAVGAVFRRRLASLCSCKSGGFHPRRPLNPLRVSLALWEVTDQTSRASFSISAEIDLDPGSAETHSSPALQDST